MPIQIIPVKIQKDIIPNDNLVDLVLESTEIRDDDILVFSQKIVSKNEGRIISLASVNPSLLANGISSSYDKDPKLIELILSESKRIVRMENGIIIVETNHGFVCANSGIDSSNVKGEDIVALLPDDSDASARKILDKLKSMSGCRNLGVIVTDTFGRAWREGHVNFSIGNAGFDPFIDYKDTVDAVGKTLKVTTIAVADELAAASELVTGKALNIPAVLIRGAAVNFSEELTHSLIRPIENDMFR